MVEDENKIRKTLRTNYIFRLFFLKKKKKLPYDLSNPYPSLPNPRSVTQGEPLPLNY